ncbi:hypothetical protein [Lacipirellula limnantheis]|jgi:hypothetical protein|uniref:DUF5673 domain-containing protein n=1 Tax=Lacipirellula limnantheis TaxID=2528024 RepID=A0A517TRY0_9BACT|nr:hypothetical protein [Lacipirellula limnantheis]QDT71136.1 hypothetical protein I41_02910 [Lacipirellula limnantheis]
MSDAQIKPLPNSTFRFPLRTVLATTTALALLAAATGALARRAPVESRPSVLIQWSLDVAGIALAVGWHWRQRRGDVHAAGEVHFVLRQAKPLWNAWRRLPLLWTLFLLIPANRLLETINSVQTGLPKSWGPTAIEGLIMLPFISIAASQIFNFIMSLRPVCLAENGLLAGDEFIGWHQISTVRWHALVRDQLQISTWSTTVRYSLIVPPSLRDKVESLLRAKTRIADTSVA